MKHKTPGGSILDPPGVSSWVNALEKGLGPGVLSQPTKARVLLQLTQLPGLLQDSPSHLGWWEVGGPHLI